MNKQQFLAIPLAAIVAVSMMAVPALAAGEYLDINNATSNVSSNGNLNVALSTNGNIPVDGSAGAFGYAVLTDGLNNVLVLVTHLPIDDSSHEDPTSGFHTHVLDLKAPTRSCSDFDAEVDLAGSGANTAFDADYSYTVSGKAVTIKGVPTSDLGDSTVDAIVSFTVTPVFAGPNLKHLCVDVVDAAA